MPFSRNLNAYPAHFFSIAETLWEQRHKPSALAEIYVDLPSATCTTTRHRMNTFFKLLANNKENQHLPYCQVMRYFELVIVPSTSTQLFNLLARHRDYLYKNLNPAFLALAPGAEARAKAILAAPPIDETAFKSEETDALFARLMSIEPQPAKPLVPPILQGLISPSTTTCDHDWKPFRNDARMEVCTKCELGRPKPETTLDGGSDFPGAHLLANVPVPDAKLLQKAIDNAGESTDNTNIGESPPTTEKPGASAPNPGD